MIRLWLSNKVSYQATLTLSCLQQRSWMLMETLSDSSSLETHGVVVNGTVTGQILPHSGPRNLELKLDSMELAMMVSSGWTSMISERFTDSGQSTSALTTPNIAI